MSLFGIVGAGVALVTLAAIAAILTVQIGRVRQERDDRSAEVEQLREALAALQRDIDQRAAAATEERARERDALRQEVTRKEEWLGSLERENAWLREELDRRPPITRRTYRILTVGLKQTGKTSLTLKWANPLVDLGAVKGTKIERYERTVSKVVAKDAAVEHVFEIHDWGGEHLVDAQQELVMEEIHGLLLVVDIAGKDGRGVNEARVAEQLRIFQPEALQYFFGPKTLATCKAVVLFINKSDVLSGTPAEVERTALAHYRPLLEALERYRSQIDLRVLVGSASSGHNTHHLFSHFVERILPKQAYDTQLLQRMKAEAEQTRTQAVRTNSRVSQPAEVTHARR